MLVVIDSYLSNEERRSVCRDLVQTIRSHSNAEILIINKHPDPCDVEADHYFYMGNSFLVGPPPQELIDSQLYEMPYTYINTTIGTCENWYPLVGVTDHVANIFNTFVVSSKIAEALGFSKILRIEYDTVLDPQDLQKMITDLEECEDYLFYGTRREGEWAKAHQYLVDVHAIGYSSRIFSGQRILKNDSDYWDLCRKIGYYGKWIEYVVPSFVERLRNDLEIKGSDFPVAIAKLFPNSKFDTINSPSEWSTSWDVIPKLCKLSYPEVGEKYDRVGLFYWNGKNSSVISDCTVVDENNKVIFHKVHQVHPNCWVFEEIAACDKMVAGMTTECEGQIFGNAQTLQRDEIPSLSTRFVFS